MSGPIELTKEEKDNIYNAVSMWINYIQTGNPVMSAGDAANMELTVKALSMEQIELIVELNKLRNKIIKI